MKKEETIKKFELNKKVLDNFDKIISMKLDEIEELKITSLDRGSKLLNIISLCASVKTLIIEGDQRINSDKILSNIFHPELLESLILNNVKLPTNKTLKRFENLNMISLNDIKFSNIKDLLEGLEPEKIEIINISNTEMGNQSFAIFEKFTNVKYLKLEKVAHFKLDDFSFLKDWKKLLKIDIVDNNIAIDQINNLIKCKCAKNIDLGILNQDNNELQDCRLQIIEKRSYITLPVEFAEYIAKEINTFKIDETTISINQPVEDHLISVLKKYKNGLKLIIKDLSCLSMEQAIKIKDSLKLENIFVDDSKNVKEYNLDTFINIRAEIDEIIDNISKHVTEPEKFLEIYKFLGNELEIVEEEANLRQKTCLKQDVAVLLRDCLQCMNIKCNIIKGYDLENNCKHTWNQVKIEGKWYNADLALDIENIKKNKTEYCLIGDKKFLNTHSPKTGKNNYCGENYNPKLIKVFFKTGLFKDNLIGSYFEVLIEKIQKLFHFNQNEDIFALPEGNSEEDEEN